MIIASLNIAKRLESAVGVLEEIINKNNIDVLCLQEADLKPGSLPHSSKTSTPSSVQTAPEQVEWYRM